MNKYYTVQVFSFISLYFSFLLSSLLFLVFQRSTLHIFTYFVYVHALSFLICDRQAYSQIQGSTIQNKVISTENNKYSSRLFSVTLFVFPSIYMGLFHPGSISDILLCNSYSNEVLKTHETQACLP
jgi:hypothetical protein